MKRPAIFLVLALAAVVAAPGCGYRTAPRPPEHTAPLVAGRPEATASEGQVNLVWDRATTSVDGMELYDLAAFLVERRTGEEGYRTVAEISVTDQERIRQQARFRASDTDPPAGRVAYRVRAVNADGQLGPPSAAVEVEIK